MYATTLFVQSASTEGLTWTEVFSDLPTDPASVFALVLLVVCVGMIAWAGRSKPGSGGSVPPALT